MIKACVVLLLLSACHLSAGQEAQTGQPDPTVFKIDTSFVWVPVVLWSEDGTSAGDITAGEFKLWDQDVPQRIDVVKTDDLPISLVILMQTGGSAAQYFRNYTELPMLLNKLLGTSAHEVTLVTFDSRIEQIWHFPARSDGVKNALRHPSRGDGGAAIKDAVHFAVEQLQDEPGHFRRIVLLLSENTDQGSSLSSRSLLEQLGAASTVVYSVAFPDKNAKSTVDHAKAGAPCEQCSSLPRTLEALDAKTAAEVAFITGGNFSQARDQQSFRAAMVEVAAQVHDGRTLGFQPSSRTPGLHNIRVEMASSRSKLHVSARSLYWMRSESVGSALVR